ncbi:MAG: trypsin-like peptidase domain-containing protein [Leptospiraceae bacterium]|nr:trypsin-like peptidase domain-containing protein [Leptospiraceae bacterium]
MAVCVLIGTVLSPIVFFGKKDSSPMYLQADTNTPVKDTPAKAQAVALENAFQDVFDAVSQSVVSISTEKTVKVKNHPLSNDPFFEHFFGGNPNRQGGQEMRQKQRGLGSGIILNEDGYILTNEHVVGDMDKLTVKLKNKKTYEAKLIGSDKTIDLALLKIKASTGDLKPVSLGDSSKVKVGNWAIAIGAPHGLEHSFTVGVVSAIARGGIDSSGLGYIQTDAAINHGNSGGPLLNIHGEVIGINRMIVSPSGGSIGIGLTIPINDAKRVFEELKNSGKVKHAWLGVGLEPVMEEDMKELKLSDSKGAVVREVKKDSPADQAGIKIMDVIVRIGDKDVETREDVIEAVLGTRVGKKIDVKLIRKGSPMKLTVTTAERPY